MVCARILDKPTASLSTGLASDEANKLLVQFGPNAVPDTSVHLLPRVLSKFWAPSSVIDVAVISMLAYFGLFMTPLPMIVLACTFAASAGFSFLLDVIKRPLFKRLEIA